MKFCAVSRLLLCLLLGTVPAAAGVLYENGPAADDIDGWTISNEFVVSDTFYLPTNSTITGFAFNAWLFPGDELTSAELSITSQPNGGTTYFDQTFPSFTRGHCDVNSYGYDVCVESVDFAGPSLPSGTYWVNLQNAMVPNGDPVYWDENSGLGCHSQGCPSTGYENQLGVIPSESFTVEGNGGTGTVPEPGSALLLGSGVLAVAGILRSKLR